GDPYEAYSYSYPHKSAYGPLTPPVPLAPLWQAEPRDALFLYFHVPFCEMRCGFCNLFARTAADEDLVDAYLAALERQARALADATAPCTIARIAVGGGTPTFLLPSQLDRLFDLADRLFGARPSAIPCSVETSPKTATSERLAVLRRRGVERVSIGVQSFLEQETHAIGRPQAAREVHAALERLRDFPVVNIDLIYGQPNQTVASWLASIRAALQYSPEELYLYPLYVRPNTGIGRHGTVQRASSPFSRLLYREAREFLLAEGYEQVSMRYFCARHAPAAAGPIYCCQTDGMLGLGCGARSYTGQLHYSSRFAVDASGVSAILDDWIGRSTRDFACADWGIRLCEDDRCRRFVIQSLLTKDGLFDADYHRLFAEAVGDAFPELDRLLEHGLAEHENGSWRLTALGLELSDAIGPSLYSASNRARMREFAQS
ncbi:MAG TPA: STM4012 family radical SAM protein, partial [Gemmataceae bacterium]|nr:STM4012 family radical SAM protein [Gemmataceae bacterium]